MAGQPAEFGRNKQRKHWQAAGNAKMSKDRHRPIDPQTRTFILPRVSFLLGQEGEERRERKNKERKKKSVFIFLFLSLRALEEEEEDEEWGEGKKKPERRDTCRRRQLSPKGRVMDYLFSWWLFSPRSRSLRVRLRVSGRPKKECRVFTS